VISLTVNKRSVKVDVEPSTPLLWVLREHLGLTGTKYGCGVAQCGACTVHLDGRPVRSCSTPVSRAAGSEIITIEGLSLNGSHPLQRAWIEIEVPQCGYCQSGQIMSWRPCWPKLSIRRTTTSTVPCPEIFAGAGPIREFAAPFIAPRKWPKQAGED